MDQPPLFSEPRSESHPECAFCKIVRRETAAYIVFEDAVNLAFLDRRPLFPGHCLLIPKQHFQTLSDLPDEQIAPLFSNAKLLSTAVQLAMTADGTFVANNNIVSQSVPHLHIHIVPRKHKDGLKGFFWPRQPYVNEETAHQVQEIVRTAIEKLLNGG